MKRLLLVMAGVMLAACSKKEPPPEPVRPVLSIKVQALNEETLGRFAGSIQARYESNVGFRVPGRIASRNVDVGAEVEKGALLATLDPTDQQNQLRAAQGDLAKIQAQLINAQANARRQQELFNRGVGAQAQLDIAQTDLKTTQASLDQAKAAVNQAKDQLGYVELRTDHRAIVTAWNAEAGQVVTAGQQVVTLAQPDIKEAVIDLPDTLVDNGFCQWDGHCLIQQPDLGYELQCEASGSDYYLLYCPVGLGFFCIEPVSHPVNAHHLPGRPGLRLLAQGQSAELGFSLQYRALPYPSN